MLVRITFAAGVLLGMGVFASAVHAQAPTKTIEIVAKDYEYKVENGYTLVGDPTKIVVHNEDNVTHGFNFSLLGEVRVKLEGGGYLAEEGGANVYRVDPGETMVLTFTWASKGRPESTTYAFWCDIHRDMEGEMLVVEVKRKAD